jgi:hypothetical protein
MNVKELRAHLKKFNDDRLVVTIADSKYMNITYTAINGLSAEHGPINVGGEIVRAPCLVISGPQQCYKDTTDYANIINTLKEDNLKLEETVKNLKTLISNKESYDARMRSIDL